jgi:hypothetical protein
MAKKSPFENSPYYWYENVPLFGFLKIKAAEKSSGEKIFITFSTLTISDMETFYVIYT